MMIVIKLKLRLLLIRSQMPRPLNHFFQQLMKEKWTQQKTVLMVDVYWQDYLIDTVGLMEKLIVVPTKKAAGTFSCNRASWGTVVSRRWNSNHKANVNGGVRCNNGNFGGDPFPGHESN